MHQFLETLCTKIQIQDHEVQQAAAFGIGIVAKNLKEKFLPYFDNTIKCLSSLIDKLDTDNNPHTRHFMAVKDNCVSSFGKTLFSVSFCKIIES